jgi:teichuronic acid biosynthesis glycosyltransferase TuaH
MPDPDACIAFGLEARTVLGQLPGRRVYYCTDSLEDHPGFDARTVRRREAAITAEADVVVACSRPLAEQLGERGVRARYVPHGCEVDRFAAARTAACPPELRDAARPLVGYAGGMNFRIDADLLAAARRGAAGGTLVLIGGAWSSARRGLDTRAAEIAALPDVVTVDHREGDELAALVAALDVGIVPYALTPFNRKSFPLKIPQFLAAGVPVVSTPNGATDEYPSVRVAVDAASFEAAVADAVAAGRSATDPTSRRWEDVAREIIDAIA